MLNSFVHGGIHPIARTVIGYAPQLIMDALRNSNALVALAAQRASILSGYQNNMQPIRRLHDEFSDCLPIFFSSFSKRHQVDTGCVTFIDYPSDLK